MRTFHPRAPAVVLHYAMGLRWLSPAYRWTVATDADATCTPDYLPLRGRSVTVRHYVDSTRGFT